jgi:hypothetical protein
MKLVTNAGLMAVLFAAMTINQCCKAVEAKIVARRRSDRRRRA